MKPRWRGRSTTTSSTNPTAGKPGPRPRAGIYDGACGSAGFLCESFDYLKSKGNLTTKDLTTLQTRTFYGNQKLFPYLHG